MFRTIRRRTRIVIRRVRMGITIGMVMVVVIVMMLEGIEQVDDRMTHMLVRKVVSDDMQKRQQIGAREPAQESDTGRSAAYRAFPVCVVGHKALADA